MKPPVLLRVYLNGELKDVKQFAEGQIVIGQSSDVQVQLSETGVSDLHAMIEERDQIYYLSDLGSQNGTFQNGKKILEAQLQSGDELVIGPYNIQFSVGVPKPVLTADKKSTPVASVPHTPKQPEAPAVKPEAPAVKPEAPVVKPEAPAVKPEAPVVKPEAPAVKPEAPAVKPEASVVKPEAPVVKPEAPVVKPEAPVVKSEAPVVKPDATVVKPDAPVVKPDATVVKPDATVVKPEAPVVKPEAPVVKPEAPVVKPDATVVKPEAPVVKPEATVVKPEATVVKPEAPVVKPEAPVVKPDAPVVKPDAPVVKKEESTQQLPASEVKQAPQPTFGSAPLPSERAMELSDEGATDLKDLKPGNGSVVEVIVAWKDRVISTHHFDKKGTVTIGSHNDNDIIVPLLGVNKTKHNFLKIESLASIFITNEMSGQHINENGDTKRFAELMRSGGMKKMRGGYKIQLNQGEMVQIGIQGELITVYVRYVGVTPKPLVAPLLDLTTSEVTAVILAMVISAIFGLYMMVYTPIPIDEKALLEETLHRKAKITFKVPERKVEVVPKLPEKKKLVKVREKPKKKKLVKVREKKVKKPKKASAASKGKPGKAAAVKPKKTKSKKKKLTSVNSGGAVKTGKKAANAQSKRTDPTKVGLLSVFGSKGTQSKLNKVYSGSGELIGTADSATGKAGQEVNRAGENLGSKIKGDAAGGKGSASVGIAGVGTKGRGTGDFGYGGGGLGKKGSVSISLGGQEASFTGSIDKEAIRRVIRANRRTIRNCYERELRADSNLHGKITLRWIIVERGRVSTASVKSNSMGNRNVANCIIARLKTWTFPEPPSDQQAEVTYPFVFSSQ